MVFVGADGKNDIHYTNFSPDILDWQFLGDVYVAKQDYTSIKVSYTYCRNANLAFFDGLSLYREEFGQSYTYDDKNNVISAVDSQKNATKFEYNENSDLTGITDPKGNKFKYEYDKKHNVTKGTSAMGVVNRLVYDGNGNITKSGTVQPDAQDKGIWIARSFTTDKNHVASVTDAEGNRTLYDWNVKSDLLNSLTDGQGNRLSYKYDSADRMTSVSQEVTADGTKQVVKNTYGYTKDKLTSIDHNGFRYGFEYDAFGNTTAASIAGSQVVQYIYESGNGNLSRTVYANGNEIRYTYDSQDRMTESYFRESSGGTEQKLNTYTYDKEGNPVSYTHLDMEWLGSENRLFPVVIDPVTTTSKKASEIYDAHVDSLYEEDNFQKSIILKNKGGDQVQRSFVRFALPEIKTGDMVINARLVLVSLAEDGKERTVAVHKVLHAWNSDSINWYNKPLYSDTVEDICRYKGDQQKYITLDITRMVKDWYQNGGNYGLMFKNDKELSGYTEFLSSD